MWTCGCHTFELSVSCAQDACIVCSDADLSLAAKHIVKGGFSYSGQRCTAVKVVLAMHDIADELLAKARFLI